MDHDFVRPFISHFQDAAYRRLNDIAKANTSSLGRAVAARLISVPLACGDIGVEIIKTPLAAIQYLIMAAINLLGVLFSQSRFYSYPDYTIRSVFWNLDQGLYHIANTPIAVALAPIKLIYQVFVSVLDPTKVESINFVYSHRHPNY